VLGVGKGYLRRDELTSVRFVPDPFVRGSSARLYRSGDLGRLLPNGDLEYLGRIDHQVKIHGFRIELGEIEAILSSQPGVRETVVVAREDSPGEKRLVAYLIPMPGASIDAQALRRSLKDRLPQYMIPAAFMFIENLPLTVNGKLDVDALPVPDETHLAAWRSPFVAPETDLQREVAKIWCDLMRISKLGLDDNFFDLGGDSVLMAQAHTRLEALIGRRFSITELFTHPTVRTLATYLSSPGLSEGGLTDVQERARLRQQAMRRTSPTNSR
jgi:acyl carrier protein